MGYLSYASHWFSQIRKKNKVVLYVIAVYYLISNAFKCNGHVFMTIYCESCCIVDADDIYSSRFSGMILHYRSYFNISYFSPFKDNFSMISQVP